MVVLTVLFSTVSASCAHTRDLEYPPNYSGDKIQCEDVKEWNAMKCDVNVTDPDWLTAGERGGKADWKKVPGCIGEHVDHNDYPVFDKNNEKLMNATCLKSYSMCQVHLACACPDIACVKFCYVECDTPPPPQATTTPPPEETTTPPPEETTAPPPGVTTAPPPGETTAPPPEETTAPPAEDSEDSVDVAFDPTLLIVLCALGCCCLVAAAAAYHRHKKQKKNLLAAGANNAAMAAEEERSFSQVTSNRVSLGQRGNAPPLVPRSRLNESGGGRPRQTNGGSYNFYESRRKPERRN